jgi:RNA polymerase sigma-70 factor, ECF subfamily
VVRHCYDGTRRKDVSVSENDWLAIRFEQNRPHLRAVAYRMLSSAADADDAVQEAWLRLSRSGADGVANLAGWLTTTVARVCLDMLRARKARREEPLPAQPPGDGDRAAGSDPEQEALLADSVGLALLVVLDTLSPAERAAFVLHDMFDLPFEDIAAIVGRTPNAARLLASRARRRVRAADPNPGADLARQREIADAFLAATRRGDLSALLKVLDPQVVLRADAAASPAGAARQVHGAQPVAKGALAFAARARFAQPALVNGSAGIVVAPRGRLFVVLGFTFAGGKISAIDVIADPERLRQLDLAALGN